MRRLTLLASALFLSIGLANAGPSVPATPPITGNITGLSISKTTATAGDMVTFTVHGSGKCGVTITGFPSQGMNLLRVAGQMPLTLTVPAQKIGVDQIMAESVHEDYNDMWCTGEAKGSITVNPKPIAQVAAAVKPANQPATNAYTPQVVIAYGYCPTGYNKDPMGFSQEDQQKKGALRCVKIAAGCPAGWNGNTDSSTGKLTCTMAAAPSCPSGWHGGMVGGKLVCDSNPQPHIACPQSTPDWQWGTRYFTESWSILGCAPSAEPPR